MKLRVLIQILAVGLSAVAVVAQQSNGNDTAAPSIESVSEVSSVHVALPELPTPLPRMAPDLALQTYAENARRQLTQLGSSSDMTIVEAALLGTGQKGRFELHRSFLAPKYLAYGAVKFVGDTFVKTNIIVKLLQSEVDHVERGDGKKTAITVENYKFSYKGQQQIDGHPVYEFHVKPRQKRPGMFKGKVYLGVTTGHIVRAEGTLVKSPSVFVKKVEFIQDYEDVAGFSMPLKMHSIAQTRLFGKAIVDITHSDYTASPLQAAEPVQPSAISSGPFNQ